MPLVSMNELLAGARAGGYAVCYCESWNLESLQAVLEAAEELHSPVVAGFNGGFLMHPRRPRPERLVDYGCLAAAVRASAAPVAFLLNETDDLAQIQEGMGAVPYALAADAGRASHGQRPSRASSQHAAAIGSKVSR